MNNQSSSKTSLDDIRSAIGVLDTAVAALMEHGVTYEQWSRLTLDPAYAALVAGVMREGFSADNSLEHLIAQAKADGALEYVNEDITSANFAEASVLRGTSVELSAKSLGLYHKCNTFEAWSAIDKLGYLPATMYEGVRHAIDSWDRTSCVGILGSVLYSPRGERFIAALWNDGPKRKSLTLLHVQPQYWIPTDRFLVVRKQQASVT